MGDRQELAVERSYAELGVIAQLNQLGDRHPGALQLAAHHAKGERRPVDGYRDPFGGEFLQQVGQPTDVVLVGVGDHAPLDAVGPFQQPGEVREYRVDPRKVVREQLAAVQHDDASLNLEGGTVASDLAEAA